MVRVSDMSSDEKIEVADLTEAKDLIDFCMRRDLTIDLDLISDPALIADLFIVKAMYLASYQKKSKKS